MRHYTSSSILQKDLTVPAIPRLSSWGDTASLDQAGKPLPRVAQVAIQQKRYAGKLIHSTIRDNTPLDTHREISNARVP